MDNATYLQSIKVQQGTEAWDNCTKAMEKYGDNHWWEPDIDPRKFAYYQIQEPISLTSDFSHFHGSVELLLGRPVFTHEFGLNANGLIAEAERAWKYQVGVTSDQERNERVQESLQGLQDWAKVNGKEVISIQVPPEEA